MKRLRAHRDGNRWKAPVHRALDIIDAMHHAHPERSEAFEEAEYRVRYGGEPDDVQACLALKRGLEPPGPVPQLRKPLYPYQEQAVSFLHHAGAGILADEPGLGKTLQGIAFGMMGDGPTLVVCPATAKHVWQREIEAATDLRAAQISGTRAQPVPEADFVIINFDILSHHQDALAAHGFGSLVADEAHRCKNIAAARTKALIHVADSIPRKALLSGTLMMNGAEDLYPPLRIVRPAAYPDFRSFTDRYMTSRQIRKRIRGRWKSQTIREGSRNLPDLHERMEPFTIRRTLREVKDQLPELRHTTLSIDLPDDLATQYKASRMQLPRTARNKHALSQVQSSMDICLQAKARVLPEIIEDRLASADRKILVFSTRLGLLDAAEAAVRPDEPCRIDGSVPVDTRRAIEERFQQDDSTRVFLGQTRACGEALTLDAADTVIIADADWSPQANEQAIRRALRINTDHPVEVIWLVVKGTLDEARLEVLERKRGEFATVMDGVDEGTVLEEALRSHVGEQNAVTMLG